MDNSAQLQLVVQKFDRLPALPGIAIKLIETIQKADPDIREISRLISSDAALSAKILKTINSSFYSLPVTITTVDHAIKLLGLNAAKNISLSLILKANFIKKGPESMNLSSFWKDSLAEAIAAKLLAERMKIKNPEDLFFLGLLGNIGSLTLAYLFPDQYAVVFSDMHHKKITAYDAENQVFGFNHSDAGSLLTRSWGLPEKFHLPIEHHHSVENLPDDCSRDIKVRTRILHISSLYVDLFHGQNMPQTLCYISHYLDAYGFDNTMDAAAIAKDLLQQTKELFPIFDLQFIDESELEVLLENAKQELLNISMKMVNDMISKDSEIESLRRQANRDELTQLYNYKAFCEKLKQEISRASRYNTPLSLILADIDFFKSVNDKYGHPAGDEVLRKVSQTLKNGLRDSDFIARHGGEEFAIILPETELKDSIQVAERLRKQVKALEVDYEGHSIRVTMSFGLAPFPHKPDISFENLVKRADDALYVSKKQGRDRCSVASPR